MYTYIYIYIYICKSAEVARAVYAAYSRPFLGVPPGPFRGLLPA